MTICVKCDLQRLSHAKKQTNKQKNQKKNKKKKTKLEIDKIFDLQIFGEKKYSEVDCKNHDI